VVIFSILVQGLSVGKVAKSIRTDEKVAEI